MIGDRIRKIRQKKNTTLKDIAKVSGLSIGYISQLERGIVEPSLTTLRKVAKALGVPMYVFMENEDQESLTVRHDRQAQIQMPDSSLQYRLATPLSLDGYAPTTLVLAFTLKPHFRDCEMPLVHHSEEIVILLSGELTVEVADEQIVLGPGDTTVIRSDVPHAFFNHTDKPVQGYSIMSPAMWSDEISHKG